MGKKTTYILLLALQCMLCISTHCNAKQKEIDYKKELPKCFLDSIRMQDIDCNKDGKLSEIERKKVVSITLKDKDQTDKEQSDKTYSIKKIKLFKNLKTVIVDCSVMDLKPLYSLKNLKKLEFGVYSNVKDTSVEFSKLRRLKTLNAEYESFDGVLDLRKKNNLKTIILPHGSISIPTKIYLQDRKYDLSGISNSTNEIFFCKGKMQRKAEIFYKRVSVNNKKGNIIKGLYRESRLYVVSNRSYAIRDWELVSQRSEKSIGKVLAGKKVKWKCANENVKIQGDRVSFKKKGIYTLIGFCKTKRYLLSVYVQDR